MWKPQCQKKKKDTDRLAKWREREKETLHSVSKQNTSESYSLVIHIKVHIRIDKTNLLQCKTLSTQIRWYYYNSPSLVEVFQYRIQVTAGNVRARNVSAYIILLWFHTSRTQPRSWRHTLPTSFLGIGCEQAESRAHQRHKNQLLLFFLFLFFIFIF